LALSIPTVIAYTAALMAVIAVALVMPSLRGQGRRWLLTASLPFLIGFLAAIVLAVDYASPNVWLSTLGVTLVIAAFSTGWHVVRGFGDRPARPGWVVLIPLSYAVLNLLVFDPWNLVSLEALYRAATVLGLNLMMAREMLPGRAQDLPSRPLMRGVFHGFAALAALRMVLFAWLPSPLGAAPSQVWSVATYNFAIVTQAIVTAVLFVALTRENAASRSEAMSLRDPMTGALNRRALEQQSASLGSGSRPVTVLVFDLDHFKRINDRFGHRVGDTVICAAVETARGILRKEDLVFRLGGEEFACVLRDVTGEDGFLIAERLRRTFEEDGWEVAGQRVEATMSVGIASAPAGPPVDLNGLIAEADRGLYRAKRRGRNQVAEGA